MISKIKKIAIFFGLKNILIALHVFLRKVYNIFKSSKNKLAIGERNVYCVPFDWITVDEYGAELNVDFESPDTFAGLNNKIDFIYSAHVFEHVSHEGIRSTFEKLKNNLNEGCIIRVEVPDVEIVIDDFFKRGPLYSELSMECLDNMKKRKPNLTEYQQDHLGFVGMISCYKENDVHIPVLIEYDNLIKICDNKDYDNICSELISLQTPEQVATHGHINYFYEERLKNLLELCGFSNIKRSSTGKSNYNFPLGIERSHRSHFSLIMEGVYKG